MDIHYINNDKTLKNLFSYTGTLPIAGDEVVIDQKIYIVKKRIFDTINDKKCYIVLTRV